MTKNFTEAELVSNGNPLETINADITGNYLQFAKQSLQPFRDFIGFPLKVRVGYRNPKRNAAAGGDPNSEHLGLKGNAAVDVDVQWYFPKIKDRKEVTEKEAEVQVITLIKDFNKRNEGKFKLTKNNVETEHSETEWSWRLTNQTFIDIVQYLRLPYNNLIDEDLKGSKWIHWGFNRYLNQFKQKTIRNINGKQVNTTIKVGL